MLVIWHSMECHSLQSFWTLSESPWVRSIPLALLLRSITFLVLSLCSSSCLSSSWLPLASRLSVLLWESMVTCVLLHVLWDPDVTAAMKNPQPFFLEIYTTDPLQLDGPTLPAGLLAGKKPWAWSPILSCAPGSLDHTSLNCLLFSGHFHDTRKRTM